MQQNCKSKFYALISINGENVQLQEHFISYLP